MKKYKNIIFDLGGVLLDIDYFKTEKAFIDLGVKDFNKYYSQNYASSLFEKLETGEVTATEFYDTFRADLQIELTNTQIENAWNAMIGGFSLEKLLWLEEISHQYNCYLFSNTNQIHYEYFQRLYSTQTGKPSFDDYFIKAFYSHILRLRKPYEEAFQKVLSILNLKPQETLFIDDTAKNIDGAKAAGMHTIFLQKPKTVFDLKL